MKAGNWETGFSMQGSLLADRPYWRNYGGGGHHHFPTSPLNDWYNWIHLTFSYNQTGQTMKGYRNATLSLDLTNRSNNYDDLNQIYIARWDFRYSRGTSIAQVLVFDRSLSDAEVMTKFQESLIISAPNCDLLGSN